MNPLPFVVSNCETVIIIRQDYHAQNTPSYRDTSPNICRPPTPTGYLDTIHAVIKPPCHSPKRQGTATHTPKKKSWNEVTVQFSSIRFDSIKSGSR
ncbi:hypothetical protein BO82DRAFT_77351 [Aspergillus uvarum CBS 121591]|uniref:Uncharacterized protein n=1 Tax=Aspergillus uvarum CBS 121591 TaxID=1448315 RepID=A0A319CDB0_9EURO|nr:hypothetical protein BO82DRAFT_77351 [Aspergillus uvarum CBS 121591]PYH81661.1 hypothetical protein BO82DRAFT_77351 [Aspergillus uvarum CBS 121591]